MKKVLCSILFISLADAASAQLLGGGLTGSGTRMLQVNSAGELTSLSSGSSSQVLFGNGTWGNLPWTTSGSNIYFLSGNVGIGTNNPTSPLDVTGNTNVTGNINAGSITSGSLTVTGPATFGSVTSSTLTANALNSNYNVSAPHILTSRIISLDSILRFGDSAVQIPTNGVTKLNPLTGNQVTFDNIYSDKSRLALGGSWATGINTFAIGTQPSNVTKAQGGGSIAIGQAGTHSDGTGSTAFGFNVATSSAATEAIAIGCGTGVSPSGTMIHSTPQSLGIGFNSTVPTMVIGPANGTANSMGHVYIGLTRPQAPYNSALLAVAGSIVSQEIFVTPTTAWADYVFKKDYKLLPLRDVAKFIAQNQHLPNVPSAEQIEKNGQNLGDIQKIQMEKIEELTLYMIDFDKKMHALEKENLELKKKINELEKELKK